MISSQETRGLLGLMALMVVVFAAAVACGEEATPTPVVVEKIVDRPVEVLVTPTPTPKEAIIIADLNWNSAQLQNRIVAYVVEHGYGYPVDYVFGGTLPMWTGLINGDVHVYMEAWLPNMQDVWDAAQKDGLFVPVGRSLEDNWQSMFLIPTYIADANPGLKSVSDLPDYMDLFVTPDSDGKARLVSCIPGWACEIINEEKIVAYGLEDVIKVQNPGSGAALDASIRGAYEKQEAWLGYYWGPTQISAELDLTVLEEPAYSDACWAADKGCAYPTAEVHIAVHPSLPGRAPEVIEFFRKWDFTAGSQVATEAWMGENEADFPEAAIWYLNNQEDVWTPMVPADVAAKVKAALAAE